MEKNTDTQDNKMKKASTELQVVKDKTISLMNIYSLKLQKCKGEHIKDETIITAYQIKLQQLQADLEEINETICIALGHSFSEWCERIDNYEKGKKYYTRICSRCGHKEKSDISPKSYIVVKFKKRNSKFIKQKINND